MENKAILYGIGGLMIGVLLTVFVASTAVNSNNSGMMRMMGMNVRDNMMSNGLAQERTTGMMSMGSSMNDMMGSMSDKSGNEFDTAFMKAMIVHHQGAIEMAKVAKEKAMHEGIRTMADDIISAQTKEIEMMQEWQKQWGF